MVVCHGDDAIELGEHTMLCAGIIFMVAVCAPDLGSAGDHRFTNCDILLRPQF